MISVVQLGTLAYADGLRLQQKLVELRKSGQIGDMLLLLEHTPVITLGRNAKTANVLTSAEQLAARGVEVFDCDRGGDVTFHGPGQIVGYPIFDLRGFERSQVSGLRSREGLATVSRQPSAVSRQRSSVSDQPSAVKHQPSSVSQQEDRNPTSVSLPFERKTLGAVDYVRRLEEVLIGTCADFGIAAKRVPGLTGVWTDPGTLSSRDSAVLSSRDSSVLSSLADSSVLSSRAEENDSENRSLESRDLVLPALHSEAEIVTSKAKGTRAHAAEAKIAAIGVHISRSVTSHGFALNVNTDLSFFDLIVPCGIRSKPVTSMQKELGREVSLADVAQSLARNFGRVFGRQMRWSESLDALLGHTLGVPMKEPKELRQIHRDDDQFLT